MRWQEVLHVCLMTPAPDRNLEKPSRSLNISSPPPNLILPTRLISRIFHIGGGRGGGLGVLRLGEHGFEVLGQRTLYYMKQTCEELRTTNLVMVPAPTLCCWARPVLTVFWRLQLSKFHQLGLNMAQNHVGCSKTWAVLRYPQ